MPIASLTDDSQVEAFEEALAFLGQAVGSGSLSIVDYRDQLAASVDRDQQLVAALGRLRDSADVQVHALTIYVA